MLSNDTDILFELILHFYHYLLVGLGIHGIMEYNTNICCGYWKNDVHATTVYLAHSLSIWHARLLVYPRGKCSAVKFIHHCLCKLMPHASGD